MKIYKLDDPQNYEQWKQCALDRQCQFIHVKAHLNCYKQAPMPHPSTNWGPCPNTGQPCFNVRDPNAMDTSPGQVRARLNTTSPIVPALGGLAPTWGLPTPRGGGRGNGFDIRTVTCYCCGNKGHFSQDCPQQTWNHSGAPQWAEYWGRGGNTQGNNWHNNIRTNQAEEDNSTEYYDAEQEPDDHHVACALTSTNEEWSKQWLEGVARESDAVKDLVIQSLWKNKDFQDTWTQWPGWGLLIVTLCTLLAIDLCVFQCPFTQVTPWLTRRLS